MKNYFTKEALVESHLEKFYTVSIYSWYYCIQFILVNTSKVILVNKYLWVIIRDAPILRPETKLLSIGQTFGEGV